MSPMIKFCYIRIKIEKGGGSGIKGKMHPRPQGWSLLNERNSQSPKGKKAGETRCTEALGSTQPGGLVVGGSDLGSHAFPHLRRARFYHAETCSV